MWSRLKVSLSIGSEFDDLKTLANDGYAKAQYELAIHYFSLQSTKKYTKAISYLQSACAKSYTPAEIALAKCYQDGIGVKKNTEKSLEHFEWAAKNRRIEFLLCHRILKINPLDTFLINYQENLLKLFGAAKGEKFTIEFSESEYWIMLSANEYYNWECKSNSYFRLAYTLLDEAYSDFHKTHLSKPDFLKIKAILHETCYLYTESRDENISMEACYDESFALQVDADILINRAIAFFVEGIFLPTSIFRDIAKNESDPSLIEYSYEKAVLNVISEDDRRKLGLDIIIAIHRSKILRDTFSNLIDQTELNTYTSKFILKTLALADIYFKRGIALVKLGRIKEANDNYQISKENYLKFFQSISRSQVKLHNITQISNKLERITNILCSPTKDENEYLEYCINEDLASSEIIKIINRLQNDNRFSIKTAAHDNSYHKLNQEQIKEFENQLFSYEKIIKEFETTTLNPTDQDTKAKHPEIKESSLSNIVKETTAQSISATEIISGGTAVQQVMEKSSPQQQSESKFDAQSTIRAPHLLVQNKARDNVQLKITEHKSTDNQSDQTQHPKNHNFMKTERPIIAITQADTLSLLSTTHTEFLDTSDSDPAQHLIPEEKLIDSSTTQNTQTETSNLLMPLTSSQLQNDETTKKIATVAPYSLAQSVENRQDLPVNKEDIYLKFIDECRQQFANLSKEKSSQQEHIKKYYYQLKQDLIKNFQTQLNSLKSKITDQEQQRAEHQKLMQQYHEKEHLLGEQKLIEQQTELRQFYRSIQIKLKELLIGCTALASKLVSRDNYSFKDHAAKTIQLIGNSISLPGVSLFTGLMSAGVQKYSDHCEEEKVEFISSLTVNFKEMDDLTEYVARILTQQYDEQIRQLTPRGASLLGECAVKYMLEFLSSDQYNAQKPLNIQLINSVLTVKIHNGKIWFKNADIETKNTKARWDDSGIFKKTGIRTADGKLFSGGETKPEKYGYRIGTETEAIQAGLTKTRHQLGSDLSSHTNIISQLSKSSQNQVTALSNATKFHEEKLEFMHKKLILTLESQDKMQKSQAEMAAEIQTLKQFIASTPFRSHFHSNNSSSTSSNISNLNGSQPDLFRLS